MSLLANVKCFITISIIIEIEKNLKGKLCQNILKYIYKLQKLKYLAHSSCLGLFLKPMIRNLLVVFK